MEEPSKKIIEINGVKMEVDLRHAKKIDMFKVGDPVKVLKIKDSYNNAEIFPGVIVGFAEFKTQPSIEIMLLKEEYSGVDFGFIAITNEEKPMYEVIHYNDYESLFTQSNVVDKFNRQIEKKRIELEEMERKKKYFINDFQKAFKQIIPEKE
jgi:hypothetical protein